MECVQAMLICGCSAGIGVVSLKKCSDRTLPVATVVRHLDMVTVASAMGQFVVPLSGLQDTRNWQMVKFQWILH